MNAMSKHRYLPLIVGFLMTGAPVVAGQVTTVKPGEPVERHLSVDEKFREWSLAANETDEVKRVKVCRVQDLCKMRFKEGHTPRTRVRNLVLPLQIVDETTPVSEVFTRQVRQAVENLRDKRVTVRFIGYTDDAPLAGRDETIYGNHVSLSKALASRVALAMQTTLKVPSSAIESDGRGATHPLASNQTAQGRTLNRRVEVEFWYDDPLQELPEEPQLCPGDADEVVTRVYDPPWGTIPTLALSNGQPIVPAGYAATLRRALTDSTGRTNARLRFIGYTRNERLDRRTASVYGDDIGLAAARARRAMDVVMQDSALAGARSEHEGRGYVQSDDVVNAGFTQGEESFVRVQAVYDERLPLDNYDDVDVTRLTQELRPKSPYELNVMHITVDGKPIDDRDRSSSDVQRCTDAAGLAEWQPTPEMLTAPTRELKYVLRAYDAKGNFDETDARPLWLYREISLAAAPGGDAAPRELLAAHGESDLERQRIPLGGGTVKVQGSGIPTGYTVWVAGRQVPVDPQGNFAAEEILPAGTHTVEVAVLDAAGSGSL